MYSSNILKFEKESDMTNTCPHTDAGACSFCYASLLSAVSQLKENLRIQKQMYETQLADISKAVDLISE